MFGFDETINNKDNISFTIGNNDGTVSTNNNKRGNDTKPNSNRNVRFAPTSNKPNNGGTISQGSNSIFSFLPVNKVENTSDITPIVPTIPTSDITPDSTPIVPPIPTSDKKNHRAIYKIFPSSYPTNNEHMVGKEYIQLLKDPSFMDNFDDVDFYMNALFKNMVNDLKNDKSEPRSILPYFQKVVNFDPTTYSKAKVGGGTKSRKHHKISKRNKHKKRRTYKKKK